MPDWLSHIRFDPPLGWPATISMVIAMLAAAVWQYASRPGDVQRARRIVLCIIRGVALVAIAWALAGPTALVPSRTQRVRQRLIVLVDTSASMARRDTFTAPTVEQSRVSAASRIELLRDTWLTHDFLSRLRRGFADLKIYAFDAELNAIDPDVLASREPEGQATNLFEVLQTAAESAVPGDLGNAAAPAPPAWILLLSDGHDTSGTPLAAAIDGLKQSGCAVISVPTGSANPRPDVALTAWPDAEVLLKNQSTAIHAVVSRTDDSYPVARIDLFKDDLPIDSRTVAFDGRSLVKTRFSVSPSTPPGRPSAVHTYRVVVTPVTSDQPADSGRLKPPVQLAQEASTVNNSRWVIIQTSNERVRVILYEGSPNWDTRFLARALRSDDRIDLTTVYALGPQRTVIQASDTPRPGPDLQGYVAPDQPTERSLNRFDAVILGNGIERFFPGPHADLLVNYVRAHGGALVLARGQPISDTTEPARDARARLGMIEPVEWSHGVAVHTEIQPTPAAVTDPLMRFDGIESLADMLRDLPDIQVVTTVSGVKPAAIVLLRQESSDARTPSEAPTPALAYHSVGQGRVLAMLGSGLWRWSLLPDRLSIYDAVYRRFWTRAVHWLALGGRFLPGSDLSIHLSTLSAHPGETVVATVAARDPEALARSLDLTLTHPDGRAEIVGLTSTAEADSRMIATLSPRHPGLYRLSVSARQSDATAAAAFTVYDRSIEHLDTAARPGNLAAISEATGGAVLGIDEREKLFDLIESTGGKRGEADTWRPVFDQPIVLILIAGLLGVEWFARRRSGMA